MDGVLDGCWSLAVTVSPVEPELEAEQEPGDLSSSGPGPGGNHSQLRVRDSNLVFVPPLSSWVHVAIFDIFQLFREYFPALNLLSSALSTYHQMKCK